RNGRDTRGHDLYRVRDREARVQIPGPRPKSEYDSGTMAGPGRAPDHSRSTISWRRSQLPARLGDWEPRFFGSSAVFARIVGVTFLQGLIAVSLQGREGMTDAHSEFAPEGARASC